ncbi:hypothetical protein [Streptomyces goshikiensis]
MADPPVVTVATDPETGVEVTPNDESGSGSGGSGCHIEDYHPAEENR